jgi:hypothetical protein
MKGHKLAIVAMTLLASSCRDSVKTNIHFRIPYAVTTTDPLEFDVSAHHRAFRSVIGTLVSQTSRDGDIGYIAESWTTNPEKTSWIYKIRPGMTFSDGTSITPGVIEKSIIRLGLQIRKKGSSNIFFEKLRGFGSVSTIREKCPGITSDDTTIKFEFDSPIPRLNHYVSFGLFGITSERDYDDEGNWLSPKSINASGTYMLEDWTDGKLRLLLRTSGASPIGHANKIKSITVSWDETEADIVSGTSLDSMPGQYHFRGDVFSGISYIHCYPWNDPKSPLSKKENRQALREVLNKFFAENGAPIVRNFFPQSSFRPAGHPHKEDIPNITLMNSSSSQSTIHQLVKEIPATLNKIKVKNIPMDEVWPHLDPDHRPMSIDCRLSGTSVLLESPDEDLHFMFESKEGIRLPDPTGKIRSHLKGSKPNLEYIESQLHEDAIVWPVAHFANGLWATKDIDLRLLNTAHPPADFTWIGILD